VRPRSPSRPLRSLDGPLAAKAAGVRYVTDATPGIRRQRCGRGFRYLSPDGSCLRDKEALQRIRSLTIPPAWTRVWICNTPWGHLQAVGNDAKGRKQYRYHHLFREARDRDKYARLPAFVASLARIRKTVKADLRRSGLPREKVLAAVVRLLETTYIRVGNDEYAEENDSFGLTTLRNRHVRRSGETLRFRFRGKSGVTRSIDLRDPTIARVVAQCQDLPGYRLFQYIDQDGATREVDSSDVNQYLRAITGQEFTAKDFRTWAGTILASREFTAVGPARTERELKTKLATGVKRVAEQLGNRPATCRRYYIHPALFEAYADGSLFRTMAQGVEQQEMYNGRGLSAEEYSVTVLITGYLQSSARRESARPRKAA